MLTTGLVMVAGEITTACHIDIPEIARATIQDVGYTRAKYGFDYQTCGVITAIQKQSPDIAMGVDRGGPATRDDVRIRDQRDAGADADAAHARA